MHLHFFSSKLLTNISDADIINISDDDITQSDRKAGIMESIALTEAVYYILLSLKSPMHGYGIMQQVEEMSSGRVRLAAGTLYGALTALVGKGWIAALPGEASSRKKEYIITPQGLEVVNQELKRLKELVENGDKTLGGQVK